MIGCEIKLEGWPLGEVFVTSQGAMTVVPVIVVELSDKNGNMGRGEAAGVDYDGETQATMWADLSQVSAKLSDGITNAEVQELLPAGGARNALDCALWDLRAKQSGMPVWKLAGLRPPQSVHTCITIGLSGIAGTRRKARAASGYRTLKVKVDAKRPAETIAIVREEQPIARIIVDANQAWTPSLLEALLPMMLEYGVELVEQPVPRDADASLEGFGSPIPLAADESCVDRRSLLSLIGRYNYINIKLDKCGGLTEALALAEAARTAGLGLMVGNMCGTSLAIAPSFLVAQMCRYVDLDGPLLLHRDRDPSMRIHQGLMQVPDSALWG
jgi:L-Ala-D/L-Glu epimerase / N-acetyl-D-glutamate racemase